MHLARILSEGAGQVKREPRGGESAAAHLVVPTHRRGGPPRLTAPLSGHGSTRCPRLHSSMLKFLRGDQVATAHLTWSLEKSSSPPLRGLRRGSLLGYFRAVGLETVRRVQQVPAEAEAGGQRFRGVSALAPSP